METAIGTTRRVFIFKNIVIKVARVYWLNALRTTRGSLFYKIKLMKKGLRYYLNKTRERKESHVKNLGEYEKTRIRKEEHMQMKILPGKRYEVYCTVPIYLFGGIMANYHERQFYKQTKNLFVMPTYFSFFGLFNIQKRGEKIDFWDNREVWVYIWRNSQNPDQPHCDGHTLADTENYCIEKGKLKLVDYGNRQVAEFLKINGENLYNNFKLPE